MLKSDFTVDLSTGFMRSIQEIIYEKRREKQLKAEKNLKQGGSIVLGKDCVTEGRPGIF
jgi:hypothetical protein